MFEQVSPETPAGAVLVAAESGRLDELLDRLLVESPSAWSCAVLDQLGHEVTTDAQREKLYLAWERQLAWTQAQRAHAMVEAAAPQRAVVSPLGGVDDFGAELVAALSGLTLSTARRELEAARALEADLVGCRSALERGQIGWRHVMVAYEATGHLPAWARQQVDQAIVCDWEVDNDLARWRVRWRREALRVDADAEQRRADAKLQRRVQCWAEPDGMATLRALLPAEGAVAVMRGLTALAEPVDADDERSIDQRRADVLVDLVGSVLADGCAPSRARQRQRPVIQATGGIRTLLGLREEPGELSGYGPITAQHLRELAADGDWQRFTTAPDTGALVGIGTAHYRPNAALRRVMTAGEPHCDFPGCAIPSQRCDADHTIAHARGGGTDPDNLRPRCRRHHRCKTHTDWQVLHNPDGTTTWITPGGYHRTFPPTRLAGDEPGG